MSAFAWLLVGAVITLGHWLVSALPYIGGACIVLALILLGAIALHAAIWAMQQEKQLELTARDPDETEELPMTPEQQEPGKPKCFLCGADDAPLTGDVLMDTMACTDEGACIARSCAATEAILAGLETQ